MEDTEGMWLMVVVKDKNDLIKSFYGSKAKKRKAHFIIFSSFVYNIFYV